MGSKKRSARQAQRAAFEASLGSDFGDLGSAFARESAHRDQMAEQHDAALRYKACERKNRYATRQDAEDAASACERHGARDLHVYRCPHCNGWHLTHKPVDKKSGDRGRR